MPTELGGQNYLKFSFAGEWSDETRYELSHLAMTNAFFVYHEQIGDQTGPFLQPITTATKSIARSIAIPPELAIARRYRGKTNELFTHFLCNLARSASDLSQRPWHTLRILDPLSGGSTTLFTGLVLGADVAGVEQNLQDVQSSVTFMRQFAQEARISHQVAEERLKNVGRRWVVQIGKKRSKDQHQAIFTCGDTADTQHLIAGFRPHLIVTDLPYGIQHKGTLISLLQNALPVWTELLPRSGCLAFSWDATRFSRSEMIQVMTDSCDLSVQNHAPYDQLAHGVDRVIKQRDVIVARF